MTFATCTSTALCLQPFISFLKQIIMMKIKNLKNLDHVYKALSNSTAWVMFSILKLNIAIGVAFLPQFFSLPTKNIKKPR